MRVVGSHLAGGSRYGCRFGTEHVFAARNETTGEVVCTSPAQPKLLASSDAPQPLPFAVALNVGDDDHPAPLEAATYVESGYDFTAYGSLRPSMVLPPAGPTAGGIGIVVRAANLAGGSFYRCCLSSYLSNGPQCASDGATSDGRFDAATGELHCTLPATHTAEPTNVHVLRISLNGQQFAHEASQSFGFWAVAPLRTVTSFRPSAGPADGGSEITVTHATNMELPTRALIAKPFSYYTPFGQYIELVPPNVDTIVLDSPRCRFGGHNRTHGGATVPARLSAGGRVFSCSAAPSALTAGSSISVAPRSVAQLHAQVTFYGGAQPLGVEGDGRADGGVRLTGPAGREAGSLVVASSQQVGLAAFEFEAMLTLRSFASLDGVSFTYASTPPCPSRWC